MWSASLTTITLTILQGMKIMSNTLPWPPFFEINNCDSNGRNCETRGFLADYMNALGQIMNFTWESHKPPDDNWGVEPLSGPFNLSGIWGGAMGSVVNGEYHISLRSNSFKDFLQSNRESLSVKPEVKGSSFQFNQNLKKAQEVIDYYFRTENFSFPGSKYVGLPVQPEV